MHNENGAEVFARLVSAGSQSKPGQLDHSKLTQIENILMINKKLQLDSNIFPNGIKNKEIVEIFGKYNSGKSEILMHLIARTLLPVKWKIDLKNFPNPELQIDADLKSVSVDLSEHSYYFGVAASSEEYDEPEKLAKVILIETGSKFSILRMFTILENRVLKSLQKLRASHSIAAKLKSSHVQSQMNKFLKECLKNLVTFKCYNNEQFILSLTACDHFIQSTYQTDSSKTQRSIIPIFIDSINFNFECIDKFSNQIGATEANCTENFAVTLIKRLVERFNVSVIATRLDCTLSFYNSNNSGETNQYSFYPFKRWQAVVDKRLELAENGSKDSAEKEENENKEENQASNFHQNKCKKLFKLINVRVESMANQENKKETTNSMIENTAQFSIENDGFTIKQKP